MKRFVLIALLPLFCPGVAAAMEDHGDDPLLWMVVADQLEWRDAGGEDPLVLEGDLWLGYDLHKLWFKADVEHADDEFEEVELQALYSRAISPFWDLQAGLRTDIEPAAGRDWLVLGAQGLAPYLFETDAALFVSDDLAAARLTAGYELLFTQSVILSPELEVNLYSDDDPELGIGSGLADLQAGLRLRYEIRREFAPYIGVNWSRQFGDTAELTRAAGGDVEETQLVLGVRAWF